MPTSVRLDSETEQLLQRLANRGACSKSEVIRVAIEGLAERALSDEDGDASLFDLVSDLLGTVDGGPPHLSEKTGKKLRDLLASRSEQETP